MGGFSLVCLLVVCSLLGQSMINGQTTTSPARPAPTTAAARPAATTAAAATTEASRAQAFDEILKQLCSLLHESAISNTVKQLCLMLGHGQKTTEAATTEAATTAPPPTLEERLKMLEERAKKSEEKAMKFEERANQFEEKTKKLEDDLVNKGAERDRRINALESESAECNCSAVSITLESKAEEFETAVRTLASQLTRVASYIQSVEGKVTTLKTQSDAVVSQAQTLQTRVAALNSAGFITRCRVCFRETEGSSQCQLTRNSCSEWSNVSDPNWTQPFRDDTDNRSGGCRYQWKIECR